MVEKVNAYSIYVEHECVQCDDMEYLDTEVQAKEDDSIQHNIV